MKEVIVKDRLGEGAFGDVYKGIIRCPIVNPNVRTRSTVKKSIYTPVAIKQLKRKLSYSGKLLREKLLRISESDHFVEKTFAEC